jgi:hypothetical protein
LELPLDHFRLLGVNPTATPEQLLNTLQQRLDRPPGPGFTREALGAREELLRASADLLLDPERRHRYECLLTEQSGEADGTVLPALEISSNLEVGGLLLVFESGQPADAFEGARRALQPPQAPALGSGREADLALLALLACREASQERIQRRLFEPAAQMLLQGIQLLQRTGQRPEQRQALENDLVGLQPYRILDLLARDLSDTEARSQGLALLDDLVDRNGGLDGDASPELSPEAFQAFIKQIRSYLTLQEQITLFEQSAARGSVAGRFLEAYALTASGFAQRKPERIEQALLQLQALGDAGIDAELACLQLLLGRTERAEALFRCGDDPDLKQWLQQQGGDPLAALCAYCTDWLQRQVLPGYRDLDASVDLEAFYADRDVQAWVERDDRRRARSGEPLPLIDTSPAGPNVDLSPFEAAADDDEALQGNALLPRGMALRRWLAEREWLTALDPDLGGWRRLALLAAGMVAAAALGLGLGRLRTARTAAEAPPPPRPAATARPAAPVRAVTAPRPAPLATPEQASGDLLRRWLAAKAAFMAGQGDGSTLRELAVPALVDSAMASRQSDADRGRRRRVTAEVQEVTLSSDAPTRRELRATIRYSEQLLAADGRVLESSGPTTLRNTYVLHPQPGGDWQVADFRPGS